MSLPASFNEQEGVYRIPHSDRVIIGRHPAMVALYGQMERIARTPTSVLLYGETGTGKELVAQAIHYSGARHDKPFFAVNCGALPPGLQESTLFGHERGAFTGAEKKHDGYFAAAHTGTLFLDEIGELSPSAQVSLLRVLQEWTVRTVGGTNEIPVDVRLIAATNKNLEDAVKSGAFQEDLLYRIDVVSLTVPPLRNRAEDIPLLAAHFVQYYATKYSVGKKELSPEAAAMLAAYDWPGNIRQLENVIQAAVVTSEEEMISARNLNLYDRGLFKPSRGILQGGTSLQQRMDLYEREIIMEAFQANDGRVSQMADSLGISSRTLYRRLTHHGLLLDKRHDFLSVPPDSSGNDGRNSNPLSPAIVTSLSSRSPFDTLSMSSLKELGLDAIVDGVAPVFQLDVVAGGKEEPQYFVASVVAKAIQEYPGLAGHFAGEVSLQDLVGQYAPHSLLPPHIMQDRIEFLHRQGILAVRNGMLPIAQVDLVLDDLLELEYGTPKTYHMENVIDFPKPTGTPHRQQNDDALAGGSQPDADIALAAGKSTKGL
ncbi:sigma-54-dependent Fis family transcriptional regulator [Candidatus Woesearchaeota archaeon]|nr:sigma-54-dependent Fis family transcriptional regulator [Candidatus Woesearchaeota archaeon]